MSYIIPKEGRDWIAGMLLGDITGEDLSEVAVGTGTSSPAGTDTSLANEDYRTDVGNANCEIQTTSASGRIRIAVSISGGTEVTNGTDITEFGVFTGTGVMLYREVTSGTVVDDGEKVTFEIDLDMLSG